ncbi:MAG TPA: anthranilate phosphoribosyltransferase [Myxococcota bacterium]|nr:anthranilate phosphoribosyltransferase [Myxococcota bacterium]
MSVRAAIAAAVEGSEVPARVLEAAFEEIIDGKASAAQMAGLLIALRCRGETVGEIAAAARALRGRAVSAPSVDPRAIDTCGTGGDGAETFNISTTAAFAVAGAGVPVAKHGNRAASSRAGSVDVLEALGVRVDLPVEAAARVLSKTGIVTFFARRAHPAMAVLAPVRAELGVRTLMNCLGPLLNPARVKRQLVGVYSRDLVEPLAAALGELGSERALVVHGSDGLDEITTRGATHAALLEGGKLRSFAIDAARLGFPPPLQGALRGGSAQENAAIVRALLRGESGARRDIVLINAGAALWVAGAADDLEPGIELARRSIDSGAALERLESLIACSNAIARELERDGAR